LTKALIPSWEGILLSEVLKFMTEPKFTFCIPNLNKREYLPACIESVLAQDCGDWRCVFVDGYSTDGSWEYMQQFASDSRFLLLRGRKQGMYADWNECLQYVDTEYFYFLTSDDTCYPQLVSKTTSALDVCADIDVCHFQCNLIDENGKVLSKTDDLFGADFIYADANKYAHRRSGICDFFMHFVYRALYTTITSLVFRRSLIDKLEGFSTFFGTSSDYDWTMRMCLFTDILYIPETLATWRTHLDQATKSVSYSQYHEWSLGIAQTNLNLLFSLQPENFQNKHRVRENVLADFLDNYASSICIEILNSRNLLFIINKIFLLLKNRAFYLPKIFIKYLSFKKLFTKPSSIVRARNLICNYSLGWPPIVLTANIYSYF
jgi:glycosyltransferase involved in cell wall biosynthesis